MSRNNRKPWIRNSTDIHGELKEKGKVRGRLGELSTTCARRKVDRVNSIFKVLYFIPHSGKK
jgi:outer membrane receptor for ferric coprogen and ferric-rhodotorulic acid